MERRGIAGPFRCPLCAANSESISHLFFNCSYSISIWQEVMLNEDDGFQWNGNNQEFFINWENRYKGELGQKKGLRACWSKLPKIVCWCIWLERNQRIFQNRSQPAWRVTAKINALLGEVVRCTVNPNNKAKLTKKEKKWMQRFNIQENNSTVIKNWRIGK